MSVREAVGESGTNLAVEGAEAGILKIGREAGNGLGKAAPEEPEVAAAFEAGDGSDEFAGGHGRLVLGGIRRE